MEDRGGIGVGGRRLLRVRIDIPDDEGGPEEFEVPEKDIERAPAAG